jgi:hypothetical protein
MTVADPLLAKGGLHLKMKVSASIQTGPLVGVQKGLPFVIGEKRSIAHKRRSRSRGHDPLMLA